MASDVASTCSSGKKRVCSMRKAAVRANGATTLLFVSMLLPVLAVVLSVVLDLRLYFAEKARLQRLLDDAALHAVNLLPYQDAAQRAASSYMQRRSIPSAAVKIEADAVTIALEAKIPIGFARLVGLSIELPILLSSRARGVPRDIFMLVDMSAYMAPDILSGAPWGNSEAWPAANYFSTENPVQYMGEKLDPKLVTQQCFNPAVIALKRTVLSAYSYLAKFSLNAVGIGVFPGALGAIDTITEVAPLTANETGEGIMPYSPYNNIIIGDTFCLSAAQHEISANQYALPAFPLLSGSSSIFKNVWSLAVRRGEYGDISGLIRESVAQLLTAAVVAGRGGLSDSSERSVLIFSGDVPRQRGERFPHTSVKEAIRGELVRISELMQAVPGKFRLYYIIVAHEGVTDPSLEIVTQELDELFKQEVVESKAMFRAIFIAETERLEQNLASLLVLPGNTAIVSS